MEQKIIIRNCKNIPLFDKDVYSKFVKEQH